MVLRSQLPPGSLKRKRDSGIVLSVVKLMVKEVSDTGGKFRSSQPGSPTFEPKNTN